ncbi:helix-turn-helix domain-containing protein [Salmonella enterica subsp. enterica]|nr:helix-turn-helix domain-containing protein [Salmonella enterica subsp. enterica]EGR9572882.1 helix-turn-helix domain-containing protein [Salmonella enterica subsp. enterica serovar Grumpensis]
MRWFDSYIDELKEKLGITSDYGVAKYLNIAPQNITKVRNGEILRADRCLKIANALNRDPLEIIATARAQKEKNPELKAIWIKLAKERGNNE